MASGARAAGAADTGRTSAHADERTPAQWYCLVFGAVLLLAGLVGFLFDSQFDTGGSVNGDELIILEVNGIHNLVHIASGIGLLAVAAKRETARLGALVFGVVYGLVTLIGFIDGDTVLGLIPVNMADNVLHLGISALGIAAGLMSRDDRADARSRA